MGCRLASPFQRAIAPKRDLSPRSLGEAVEKTTKGRISADDLCHEDPVFLDGRWAFGQTGAAQSKVDHPGGVCRKKGKPHRC